LLGAGEVPRHEDAPDLLGVLEVGRSASVSRLTHDRSTTASCSARYSSTAFGTSNGSARNKPKERTVVSCKAKPSRLWCPRRRAISAFVGVVEEEGPLQLRSRRRTVVATVGGRLRVGQELNGHGQHGRSDQRRSAGPSLA